MTINERILALRRAAGLSQEALAEQVGVSRQAIGKWESGASLPGLDNLQELARALGVSCDELLTGKESGTENTAGQDGVALESVKALLDAQNAAQAHAAHRQRILLAGLAAALACVGAALVYLGVYYGGRMRELSSRVDDIGANVAGIEGSIIVEKVRENESKSFGYDAYNDKFVDMIEAGILDPTKVTRSALQNAASASAMLLTTEAGIVDIKEPMPPVAMGGAGAPGMGGMGMM